MGGVLLVGCGRMGRAMLDGWFDRGLPPGSVIVVEPAGPALPSGVTGVASPADLPANLSPDVVVLAVKPQAMDAVLPDYRRFAGSGLFLSIAAGRTIASFEAVLGDAAIVRAMPNTPAAVRRGITVACANARVSGDGRARCQDLLEAVGDVAWIDDEGLMDAVTAVSGSGPAYVFLLVETLAEAGRRAGLPEDLAMRLARATVAGSGELLARSPETAAVLRRNVTSPGGTTAAALSVLTAEKDGLQSLMTEAVAAAARRSRELAG